MSDTISLTPKHLGAENYQLLNGPMATGGAKALAGTGFDPNNPQHFKGSDAVRWAIALQQLRDKKDFETLDRAKKLAQRFCKVMQEPDGTRVFPLPSGYSNATVKEREMLRQKAQAAIADGILYDA